MKCKVEICVDSLQSAENAQVAGADRVELCSNLTEGGTTPSAGTIYSVRDNLSVRLHVIIRPRRGDFLYSDPEYDIMRRDIEICGECGVDGIVTGILRPDGTIDVERTARLAEMAYPMSLTFHRAFDLCPDPVQGLEDVVMTGAAWLLTSGQKDKVPDGAGLISKLVRQAGKRITILPGGGLDESNIAEMARITGAREFNLTCRIIEESAMQFRRSGIRMGGFQESSEFSRKIADPWRIKKVIGILEMI